MKIGWLLGWAVPEAWFAPLAREAFPGAAHAFFPAGPESIPRLEEAAAFEWIVGYSLGSLLLLQEAARVAAWGRVALLAPIFAFPREAGLGGKIPRAQIRHLKRRVLSDPRMALPDFYQRAGLDVPSDAAAAFAPEPLLWGLERLEGGSAAPPLPPGWLAWCGAEDALLDAAQLHAIDGVVRVVTGATHHPRALLRAFAAHVQA